MEWDVYGDVSLSESYRFLGKNEHTLETTHTNVHILIDKGRNRVISDTKAHSNVLVFKERRPTGPGVARRAEGVALETCSLSGVSAPAH